MQNQGPDVSDRRRKPNGQFDNELLPKGDKVELSDISSSEISSMVSEYGLPPEEANKWIQYDFTAEEVWRWGLTCAFSPKDAHDWKEQRFAPYDAAAWRNAGIISAREAVQWRIYRFEPDEASEWRRLDFSTSEALKWSYYGFTADQANHWRAAGFSDQLEASKWNDKYPGAPWRARIDKEDLLALEDEAGKWEQAGFTAEDANDWVDEAGIEDVDEAIQWRDTGFTPEDAHEYIRAGIHDAHEAAKLRDKHISPKDLEYSRPQGMGDLPL